MARKIVVTGNMKLSDYEVFGANERRTIPFEQEATLDDNQLQQLLEVIEAVGGEVRGELDMDARLLGNGDVRLKGSIRLYEGTSETSEDLDGERYFSFIVKKGMTVSFDRKVVNTDEGDPEDYVRVSMTCKNLHV